MLVKLFNSDLPLLLPEGYREVITGASLYDEMYHARKAYDVQMYQNLKSESYGNVVIAHIDSRDALPFGNKDALINEIHNTLNEDQGLIEVEAGTNPRGFEFIYSIIKTYHQDLLNVNYCLRMDIKNGDEIIEVLGSFFETRMTGIRSSHGYALVMNAGFETDEETGRIKGYAEDPYDPEYTKGCRMILPEKRGLDGMFPNDPLSQTRELVLALTEDSFYKTREELEAEAKKENARKKGRKKSDNQNSADGQNDDTADKQAVLQRLFSNDVVRKGAYKVDITEGEEEENSGRKNALSQAASRAAGGLKAAVAKTSASFDKVKTPFDIPDDYRNKLNQPVPKELPGWGKRAFIGFGKGTPFMSGICMSWPVTESESMPLTDFTDLIDKFHSEDMGDNQGLVYAKCGLTPKGNRYACGIRKMRFADAEGNLGPINYELGFNIRLDGSFQSRDGMPGHRGGMLELMSRGSSELQLTTDHWSRDPYDAEHKNGLLMEWTEDEKYDDLFLYDPLSEARMFIQYLVANN